MNRIGVLEAPDATAATVASLVIEQLAADVVDREATIAQLVDVVADLTFKLYICEQFAERLYGEHAEWIHGRHRGHLYGRFRWRLHRDLIFGAACRQQALAANGYPVGDGWRPTPARPRPGRVVTVVAG